MIVKLACDAKFAMLGDDTAVMGDSSDGGVTVMGGTKVERDCS